MSRGASPPDFSAENSILGRDRRRVARHRAHTPAYANLSGSAQGAEVSLCEILNLTDFQVIDEQALNKLGDEGWELVAVTSDKDGWISHYVLKRPR